ncbi:MAG: PIN domain-containing protein [Pirellulaceae bacterium]|nr:PIN domain-containing protein [Pirellulaceae bacterium]
MERVFLDANILFSAAYRDGAGLQRLWAIADVRLLSSTYAVEEARRNLESDEQRARLDSLTATLELVAPLPATSLPPGVVLPEKDSPILLAAIAGRATHLLTGDVRHFGPLFDQSIGGVLVQLPAVYLAGKP